DEPVTRSLITLKLLTYFPTGGILAAPTTSLPETIGGVRNWDYRACWIRDATFSLHAFISGGYLVQARAWRGWLLGAAAGWHQPVTRSLITLQLLTYCPTGGVLAAPTTSLPETIGGVRNWDYRACWIRDATFSLYAFISGGYLEEARAWREWLLRAAAGRPE